MEKWRGWGEGEKWGGGEKKGVGMVTDTVDGGGGV